MSTVIELAEAIKDKGRRSTQELPTLLQQAERFAGDDRLNPVSRALAYRAAANALQLMSNFEAALSRYDSAIAILESIAEPAELGRTLHAKIGLLNFMSRFDELLLCAARARSIFETLHDRHRLARLDVNVSAAYIRLNRFDMVLRFAEQAMAVLEELGDIEGFSAALTNSAVALRLMNNFEEAERRYSKALEIAEKHNWPALAMTCRFNIAFLQYLRGDSAEALSEFGTLRARFESRNDRNQACLCLLSEAEILLEIGDVEAAVDAARKAKTLARELGLNLETGKALVFEAIAARRTGTDIDARSLLDEAAGCFQLERNTVWSAIAKLEVALVRGDWDSVPPLDDVLTARAMLQESGLPSRLALADIVVGRVQKLRGDVAGSRSSFQSALIEAGKGRSEWMQFHAAHELGNILMESDPQEALGHLRIAEQKLDSLWHRLGSDDMKLAFLNDRESVYTPLVRLALNESTDSAFDLSEKARSRVLAERLGATTQSAADLASSLSSDETIVEYFVEGPDILIFTLSQEGSTCHRQINGALEAQTVLDNFERHIQSCSVSWERLVTARKHQLLTADTHLRELYRILVEPIAQNLRKRVIVVPHGLLHRVPFDALSSDNNYLIEKHEIAYSPSAALYCNSIARLDSNSAVFIAFSGAQKTTAEDEVREAAARVAGALCLVNPSIPQLQEVFKTPHALVHIAGHAGIDSIGGRLSWIETPQGRLTHRDLSNLSISAKTIVITGCQTARRTINPGDEWQGLMRAFYMSGASAVVSALWDIRDQSARQFASEFYKTFDHDNVLTAVQAAMKSIRQQQDHPYFWAGFSTFVRRTV